MFFFNSKKILVTDSDIAFLWPAGYFNDSLAPLLYRTLSCMGSKSYERVPDLENDRFLTDSMGLCFFPGAPFFKLASRFIRTEKEVARLRFLFLAYVGCVLLYIYSS